MSFEKSISILISAHNSNFGAYYLKMMDADYIKRCRKVIYEDGGQLLSWEF